MDVFNSRITSSLLCLVALISSARAGWERDVGQSPNSAAGGSGMPSSSSYGEGGSMGGQIDPSQFGMTAAQVTHLANMVTVHAVLACVVWVFFIPVGGILLRLGLKSSWILRIHYTLQSFSYLLFIVAAGIGIWLVQQFSYPGNNLWNDPHPRLGLAILAIAFFQPLIGYIHHQIFKKRSEKFNQGQSDRRPGRTASGHVHMWVGRSLIVLGMINGGLGLRLSSKSPFAENANTKFIAYGVCTGVMFLIYATIVTRFEIRKAKQDKSVNRSSPVETNRAMREPIPSSEESSLRKEEISNA